MQKRRVIHQKDTIGAKAASDGGIIGSAEL